MIRRPGPGKWVGFIRNASLYFEEQQTRVIPRDALHTISSTLTAKNRPRVKIRRDSGNRIDYYEALINIRNRFAHTRQLSRELSSKLFSDYYVIWKALLNLIKPVFDSRVLLYNEETSSYCPFDAQIFDEQQFTVPKTEQSFALLWNAETGAHLPLLPLIILYSEPESSQNNALFLEEMKGKNLLYLFRDKFIKRKEEYGMLIRLLDAKKEKIDFLSARELSVPIFRERLNRITKMTLIDFEDALKYIPAMYIERESMNHKLDAWLVEEKPGAILVGEPGSGKTSFVAHWAMQHLTKGDLVLLLEASRLKEADLPKILVSLLNLDSPLKDCLETVGRQMRDDAGKKKVGQFILIIDAVNEFVGHGLEHRGMLWREINSLIDRFDDYCPYFKCLVTTRSDLWRKDFPKKDSTENVLKRRLYSGSDFQGFPALSIGNVTDEEAENIYEHARKNIPGLAPVTPYQELPMSTRGLLNNPFLLRLVLQAFNDNTVPSLTENKLIRHFAREKALAEKEKMEILFLLLERMSEFKKTELSLDEFLYGKIDEIQIKKSSRNQIRNLEKIIFNPRPQSPYRKLIEEGLIEERSIGDGEAAEEHLAFTQEKVANLMYGELKRREIRRIGKGAVIGILLLLISIVALIFLLGDNQNNIDRFDRLLRNTTLSPEISSQFKKTMSEFYVECNAYHKHLTVVYLFYAFLFGLIIVFAGPYFHYWFSKRMTIDLPSRFIREKFNTIKSKSPIPMFIMGLPIIPVIIVVLIYEGDPAILVWMPYIVPVAMAVVLMELIARLWVVLKFSPSPQSVYFFFGLSAAKQTGFKFLVAILIAIALIPLYLSAPLVLQTLHPTIASWDQVISDSIEYETLEKRSEQNLNDKIMFSHLHKILFIFENDKKDLRSLKYYWDYGLLYSFIGVFIAYPLSLLLTWLLAAPLEKHLNRKMYGSLSH